VWGSGAERLRLGAGEGSLARRSDVLSLHPTTSRFYYFALLETERGRPLSAPLALDPTLAPACVALPSATQSDHTHRRGGLGAWRRHHPRLVSGRGRRESSRHGSSNWAERLTSPAGALVDGVRAGPGGRGLVAARADLGPGSDDEPAPAVRAARTALTSWRIIGGPTHGGLPARSAPLIAMQRPSTVCRPFSGLR
jgi:hypothetical protein